MRLFSHGNSARRSWLDLPLMRLIARWMLSWGSTDRSRCTWSVSDYELFVAKCDLLLRNWGSVVIVSGGARGADALAKRYAVDRGYCYMEFPADWDTYGRRAGYIRNRAMHEYISTHENRGVIAFWDGKSRGTRQSFSLAGSYSNPLRVVHVPVA